MTEEQFRLTRHAHLRVWVYLSEEQFRLTRHAHLLVWVYLYSSSEQLRDDLGTSLELHVDLVRFVARQYISKHTNRRP